ncbi:N/A [soil metagenome]
MRNPFKTSTDKNLRPLSEIDSIQHAPAKDLPARMPVTHEQKTRFASTSLMLFVAVAAGFGGGWLGARNQSYDMTTTQAKQQIISNESQLVNSIAKNVGVSVVSVVVKSQTTAQDFFGFAQPQTQEGAGTGVILTKGGLVITNRHVVPAGTTSVSITLSDGTEFSDVTVVGRTSDSDTLDIAFLQIKDLKGKTLTPAVIGDSSKVQVGDKVVAIGNALGQFRNTVTSGIISGFGRNLQAGDGSSYSSGSSESLQNLFQTDAAINLGNSGGPLVNINGEIIGINVAMADAQSIGFAIPINDVKGLIASVEKSGKLERPYLGVRYVLLTDDYAYTYNLNVKRGAYIAPGADGQSSVIPGSPAEKAGLKEKDIITAINGTKVDENNSLISIFGRSAVGDKVKLSVNRDGKEIKIEATLEAAPQG